MVILSASLLAANLLDLEQELNSIHGLVDSLHLDIMDGHEVANLGLSLDMIKKLPPSWNQDAHLMVSNPTEVMTWLKDSNISLFYIHAPVWEKHQASVSGIVLNPDDSIEQYQTELGQATDVLIMGVHPGQSGQQQLSDTALRVAAVRKLNSKATIAVDGGVNDQNAGLLAKSGATKLIVGSYLFKSNNRHQAIARLRLALQ